MHTAAVPIAPAAAAAVAAMVVVAPAAYGLRLLAPRVLTALESVPTLPLTAC